MKNGVECIYGLSQTDRYHLELKLYCTGQSKIYVYPLSLKTV